MCLAEPIPWLAEVILKRIITFTTEKFQEGTMFLFNQIMSPYFIGYMYGSSHKH